MKKFRLIIYISLFCLFLTSCRRENMTKEMLAKELIKIENEFKKYALDIKDIDEGKSYSITYLNLTTKSEFEYYFIMDNDINDGIFVYTYTKTIDQSLHDTASYIYYGKSKRYYSSVVGLGEDKKYEGSIAYSVFYLKYLKPQLYSFNLDFNQIKEFSFVDHHAGNLSADIEIVFNEDYHYIFKNEYFDVDMTNVSCEVDYSAETDWEVSYVRVEGINEKNENINIMWNISY